ncbi:MAG: hypothetical protein JRN15_10350 [Nitrososphaerota archaeon]|nr:hypothetical protein [Nitrososphaerota archaeon]
MALDLNLILLLVELVLLVPTLLLLLLGRREEKGRQALLKEITKTAKMLSRQEYFNFVLSAMMTATESIKGSITGSVPTNSEEEDLVRRIAEQIKQALRNHPNLSIRYLLPRSQDRLSVAYRYKESGAEVRFHRALIVTDLRYMIVDHKVSVVGLPNAAGDDQPTKEGYLLPSEDLADTIDENFERKWKEAATYDEYAKEVLSEIRSQSRSVSSELLSAQLKVPNNEIARLIQVELKPDS